MESTLDYQAFLKALQRPNLNLVADPHQYLLSLSQRSDCEDTFHIVDLTSLFEGFQLWQHCLPDVLPHYSVKTNPDSMIISTMALLGAHFDCASKGEIDLVLSLGVDPNKILFANPRKSPRDILHAKDRGVRRFTFDSLEELEKITHLYPTAQLLLRMKTDDSHSSFHLSTKFGAHLDLCYHILDTALSKKIDLIGLAFHVGSNCCYVTSYKKAIFDAITLFNHAKTKWNKQLSILDIGGGWPGSDDLTFRKIAAIAQQIIHDHFDPEVQVIAEPGRFFAARTTTLAMHVLGKDVLSQHDRTKMVYFMSNGVYGFFQTSLYFQYDLQQILQEGWQFYPLKPPSSDLTYPSLLWGATCDSGDKIIDQLLLPELNTGDILLVSNMGAYGACVQTSFNGMPFSQPYYLARNSI